MAEHYDMLLKIVIVGDSGVGKSSVLRQYAEKEFNDLSQSTIGIDFRIKTVQRDGKVFKLQIWDTAGQERFKGVVASYYRGAHAVILVYDVCNRPSFENLALWLSEVRQFGEDPRVVIVGNKADKTAGLRGAAAREVTHEMVQSYVACLEDEYRAMTDPRSNRIMHFETSAKTAQNVPEMFAELLESFASFPVARRPDTRRSFTLKGSELVPEVNTPEKRCIC